MIVLDTTVLVYAKGAEHAFRDPCRELLAAIADRRLQASTTPEVIRELAHVRAKRRGRADAAALGRDYADLLSPLISVTASDLRSGLDLFERIEGLGAFDAVLAAAASAAGARALVSADVSFAALTEPAHVVPDEAGVASLLRK